MRKLVDAEILELVEGDSDSEDEGIMPDLLARFVNDDDSFCTKDTLDEPSSSNSSRFAPFQEASSSRSFKINEISHSKDESINYTNSFSLEQSPERREDQLNDTHRASASLNFSCLPPSLNNSYSPSGLKPNDDHIGLPNEPFDLKVHDSARIVSMKEDLRENQSKLKLPSKEEDDLFLDLKELPLDGKFCSLQDEGAKSVMHQQAVNRHKELLGKFIPERLHSTSARGARE